MEFNTVPNKLSFLTMANNGVDGIKLNKEEQQYLLPHFSMMIVGKPGSGKSTMVKQIVMNEHMYKGKFD
jgi:ABC-type ATPase involved in cell division